MEALWEGLPNTVYASFIKTKKYQQELLETTDPFLLKKRVEVFYEEEKRNRMRCLATRAFQDMKSPVATQPFRFRPGTTFPEKEYWGCDAYGYGWNLWGMAISLGAVNPVPVHVEGYLLPLVQYLTECLERGDPLTRCFHMSVAEVRSTCLSTMMEEEGNPPRQPSPSEEQILQDEVAYPGSLVHLVRKRFAPTINGLLQHKVDQLLLEGTCRLLPGKGEREFQEMGWRLRENIRVLFLEKKLPLSTKLLERVDYWTSRQWKEKEVWQAASFVPRSSCLAPFCEVHEDDHERYSPLAPRHHLGHGSKKFRHALEYVYFWLLLDYCRSEDEAFQKVQSVEEWTDSTVQHVVRKAQYEFMFRQLARSVRERLDHSPRWQWMLLTTDKVQVEVPYDPAMSHALSKVLCHQRLRLVNAARNLCRWIAPRNVVTRRDFCAYHAVTKNLDMWNDLFSTAEDGHPSLFFAVFYPRKTCVEEAFKGSRVQSPESVLRRMEKECKGAVLDWLAAHEEKASVMVASILYNACFPQDVLCRRPRKMAVPATIHHPFLKKVLKHW
jgi:hypothetical protein